MVQMIRKLLEFLLQLVGFGLFLLSILFYFGGKIDFMEGTIAGCVGLSLILFNASQIRDYLKQIIDKNLGNKCKNE